LSSIGKTEKSRVDGEWQSCCILSNIPWRGKKCASVRCCDATASYFVAKVRGEVFAHFNAVAVERNSSMRTVWPTGESLLWTVTFLSKKMMSMLLTFFICLAFSGLGEFELSVYGSCFLPRMLV
jgi:hypothetical protein